MPCNLVGKTAHLWIAVFTVDSDGKILIVNLTARRAHSDLTVEFIVNDHPFIKQQTVVNFGDAMLVDQEHLKRAFQVGIAQTRPPCSQIMLDKIQAGFLKSPHTKKLIYEYATAHFGDPDVP